MNHTPNKDTLNRILKGEARLPEYTQFDNLTQQESIELSQLLDLAINDVPPVKWSDQQLERCIYLSSKVNGILLSYPFSEADKEYLAQLAKDSATDNNPSTQ